MLALDQLFALDAQAREVATMLTSFRVQNFKNLRDVRAEFGPINAIVGPNGAGKSSLLQAIDFLRAFFESSVEVYFDRKGWDYRDLPNVHEKGKITRWTAHAELTPETPDALAGRYEYTVHLQPKRYPTIGKEELKVTTAGSETTTLLIRRGTKYALLNRQTDKMESFVSKRLPASVMSGLDDEADADKYPELLAFRDWIRGFRSYLLWDPDALRGVSRREQRSLGERGENLASVMQGIKAHSPKDFERILRTIRRLFPRVEDISIRGPKTWGWFDLVMTEGGHILNSRQMSDGILRVLAVASFLYAEDPPTLLSMEEPENGVHPQLLRDLIGLLRELHDKQGCQVFFTTHSPYALDEFVDTPEAVQIMSQGTLEQGAQIARLSEHKDIDLIREEYESSLGEAWFSGLIGGTAKGTQV